jgi:hypothetical protein
MFQTAPPPLRESPSATQWTEVLRGVDVTEVELTGRPQARAEAQLDPPRSPRGAERRRRRGPSGFSHRRDAGGSRRRVGHAPCCRSCRSFRQISRSACRPCLPNPSPPGRTLLTPAAGRGHQASDAALPPEEAPHATSPGWRPRCSKPAHRALPARCGAMLDGEVRRGRPRQPEATSIPSAS